MKGTNNINRGMSRSFFKFGIVILLIAAGLFTYKNFSGYTKVTKVTTYENCKVSTWAGYNTISGGNEYHIKAVKVERTKASVDIDRLYNDEEYDVYNDSASVEKATKVLYDGTVSWSHTKHFLNYDQNRLTVYKTDKGREFPVYVVNCDEKEAEREFRRIDPPTRWYILYGILTVIGVLCFINAFRQAKVAKNFENENYQFVPQKGFESFERSVASLEVKRMDSYDRNQEFLDANLMLKGGAGTSHNSPKYDTSRYNVNNEYRWKQREWREKDERSGRR